MGLTSALNTALFGISYNQKQIDVTASNIANADSAGYSTKALSAKVFFDRNGGVSGLVSTEVTRIVDERIQASYFDSLSDTRYAGQIASFTDLLDDIFGTIGDSSSLTSLSTELTNSLSTLVNSPDSYPAQQQVVASADAFARELNSSYEKILELRQQADATTAAQANTFGELLESIKDVDEAIADADSIGVSSVGLQDQRDRYVEQLTGYLDVDVTKEDNNSLTIRTSGGHQLYANNQTSKISFAQTNNLQPGASGNSVRVTTPGGTTFDLLSGSQSGSLVALAELRDEVLVEAQAQLDTIAAEASLAFSNVTVDSTAATVGLESGFTQDVSGLQAGNTVSLVYVDNLGATQNVTFVAVDDAALLPLADTATSKSGDTVYGIDISSGTPATYVTQMIAALAATSLNVSDDGGGNLQVLGDVGTNTTVTSLSADVTVSGPADQGLGLSIFVDQTDGTEVFTDALENGGQRLGYARGIGVNPALKTDSSLLVTYQTTPATNSPNDPARAQYLLNALTSDNTSFDPGAGIGSISNPYEGNVLNYINQVTAYQGNQAEDAQTFSNAKQTLTTNLAIRYEESYSVDVDAEMAFLIQLQNAYAANARVMQAVNELFDTLLRSV